MPQLPGRESEADRFASRSAASAASVSLVRCAGKGSETGLKPIVCTGDRERPREQAPETGRERGDAGDPGRDPGTSAARARDELTDRLFQPAGVQGLLVVGLCGCAFYEWLADEARDLVMCERPSGLESCQRKNGKIKNPLFGVPTSKPPGEERGH